MNCKTKNSPLFVVSGPSGSGKTSICRQIAQDLNWYYSVSHTTRPKKELETNGRDYFFIDKKEFLKMIDQGDFLEWAQVYDNYYGTLKKIIEEKLSTGQGVILDVDTQGASSIKKLMPHAVLVFIKTPHINELKKRLDTRGRDSKLEIKKRINKVKNELSHINEYDHVVVNDQLDRAVLEIKNIIKKKTK